MIDISRRNLLISGAAAGAIGVSSRADGQVSASGDRPLRIGVASEPTTMDPQFYNLTPNVEAAAYVFETLVDADALGALAPRLAASWRLLDERTWELRLRDDVLFHDGTRFTADDVLASFARVPTVTNSPSNYEKYISAIVKAEAAGPHTLHISTAGPYPSLLSDLTQISMVPRRFATARTTDFNSGAAMVGTGPYRFVEWVPGDRMVYQRNDAYWGARPVWDRVTVRPISNAAARTAALLSRTVDLINQVPPDDLPRMQANPAVTVRQIAELRLMYLRLDTVREPTPWVRSSDGRPLARNPLRDLRVRRAISKAINRTALVEHVMAGQAVAAGDILPAGTFGTLPDSRPEPYDIAGGRQLMAEAGWAEGFNLTLHGPNDRYLNDAKVVQALAQMLSRLGIRTTVETMPRSVYFTRLANNEFSASLIGTSPAAGVGTMSMQTYMFVTRDAAHARGAGNWSHYSNPELDRIAIAAAVTVDDAAREALLREAGRIVLRELPVVPLYFGTNTWAMHAAVDYLPRVDGATLAAAAMVPRA